MKEEKLSSSETAKYLGYTDTTIRNSRYLRTLSGGAAPPHHKVGHRIFYIKGELDEWVSRMTTEDCPESLELKLEKIRRRKSNAIKNHRNNMVEIERIESQILVEINTVGATKQ